MAKLRLLLLPPLFAFVACSGAADDSNGDTYNPPPASSGGGKDASAPPADDASSPPGKGGKKDGGGKGHQGDAAGDDDDSGPTPQTSYTFGSHPLTYPSDVLHPTGAQSDLDLATTKAYDAWKAKYVKQGCNGYYVLSGGGTGQDVGDEVSEGHGYGMVITAIMAGYDPDAKKIFDGMYDFFHEFPTTTHQNLMSWTVNVKKGCTLLPSDHDSATDGDLDVGFALLLADKQWPNQGYLDKAKAVIADLKSGDMHATTHEPVLGDWATPGDAQYDATRPSDFMLDHFRAFGAATGDATWTQSVDAVYGLVAHMQTTFSPTTGLLPDFIIKTTTAAPTPAPSKFLEDVTDGEYGYNSCRVPWRIATDYIVSHDPRAKAALDKINAWIIKTTNGNPSKILDGYTLAGGKGAGQSGPSAAFSSPFGVSAMVWTDQAWLDAIWKSRAINEDYYADTITMIDLIVMSGNWWSP